MPYRRKGPGVEAWTANMLDQSVSGSKEAGQGQGDPTGVAARLAHQSFAFLDGASMRAMLGEAALADWDGFARSWEDLGPDHFMADGGTYRKRRYACLQATENGLRLKSPRPHHQTLANNPLNGGVERVFLPVEAPIALHPANRAVIETCRRIFEAAGSEGRSAILSARQPLSWHVEMHQFRIEARPDVTGQPTPEGLHRDGVDWVLVLMIRRANVEGGITTIADRARRPLAEASLSEPLDASLVDDHRVFHGVSSVMPLDPSCPAWRDVLVLTFRAEPGKGEGKV